MSWSNYQSYNVRFTLIITHWIFYDYSVNSSFVSKTHAILAAGKLSYFLFLLSPFVHFASGVLSRFHAVDLLEISAFLLRFLACLLPGFSMLINISVSLLSGFHLL